MMVEVQNVQYFGLNHFTFIIVFIALPIFKLPIILMVWALLVTHNTKYYIIMDNIVFLIKEL